MKHMFQEYQTTSFLFIHTIHVDIYYLYVIAIN